MMEHIRALNSNKLFIGLLIILTNVGGRYIIQDIPKGFDNLLKQPWMRLFILFGILFAATRDIEVAIFLTIVIQLIIRFLLDEASPYCIIPRYIIDIDANHDGKVSVKEIEKAQATLDRYKKAIGGGHSVDVDLFSID